MKSNRNLIGESRAQTALIHVLLVLGAAIILLPFFWMLVTSLKSAAEITRVPPRILPSSVTTENFIAVLTIQKFGRFIANSFIISFLSMAAVLLTAGAKGKRFILKNAEVMIHQPIGGAEGQATDLRRPPRSRFPRAAGTTHYRPPAGT